MTSLYSRIWPLILFSITLSVLLLAYILEPEASGIGTHQQLGLEPCGFLTRLKIPCMMCGMTTSFSLYMHIQVVEGVLNQPFSLFLFGGTVYTCSLSLLDLIDPQERISRFLDCIQDLSRTWYVGMLILLLAGWIFKIFLHIA
ncbi:MAG: hypothetical protein CL916_03780 [Deltaproteobacteria bacterium]|nr:hypothetical protein [Deltaproteobacteria bacterium]